MLKAILIFIFSLSLAHAGRFEEADKIKFLDEVKQEIAQHKLENNGKVDLQIIKPEFYKGLEEYQAKEKFTKDEMLVIKQRYENLSKDSSINSSNAEAEFYKFLETQLDEINKRPLLKIKEGEICNLWSCEKDLKCAPDPIQVDGPKGTKASGKECKIDADCASNECLEDPKTKKKTCEDVYRCYKPVNEGQSCVTNPVCGVGSCLPYNSLVAGIGECTENLKKCSKNSDCCSNLCGSGGVCRENFICKDCVQRGKKVDRGRQCCEGLIPSENGICIPDVPPTVIPQVNVSPIKKLFISFVSMIFPSAEAGVTTEMISDFKGALAGGVAPKAGDTTDWADGTLTRLPNGNLMYDNRNDGVYTKELASEKDLEVIANENDEVRTHFVDKYGVDILGTKNSYASNQKIIDSALSSTGPANSKVELNANLPADYYVSYNENGKPSKITIADKEMTIDEFKASNYYKAAVGSNDKNPTSLVNISTQENIVAGDKATCEAAISQQFSNKVGTCTMGGGCGGSNPDMYGICTDGSDLAWAPGKEPKTDEQIAKEENEFLKKENKVDDQNILGKIRGEEISGSFQAKSDKFTPEEKKLDKLKLTRASNFETCELRFKDDFMHYLRKNNLLELEMALLGFDFVMSGEGVSDYWMGNGGSIYDRLKVASKISKEQRAELWTNIDNANKELTCMCLDAQGLDKIKLPERKQFFIDKCPEYAKYKDPATAEEELSGDASGIKGKRLLVAWTSKLTAFNRTLVSDHTKVKQQVGSVLEWMSDDQKWNETEQKKYPLFSFSIKNYSGSAGALGAVLGAILAAGVIAIMGGFGTASILSGWAAAGIISASALTGAGSLWMISSLRGAWISKKPEISDKFVRTYGCGKKETCTEFSRELIQPYNKVCNVHTSANACVKDFIVIREMGRVNDSTQVTAESTFLVDPWVPYTIPNTMLIKDSLSGTTYADKLEKGFQGAKDAMVSLAPARGGGGKKGGGDVPESYLSTMFLDPKLVGEYVRPLGSNLEEKYFLKEKDIQQIKKAAIAFALKEKFFEEGDTANLNIFAEYAYEYHFVYPKRSRHNEISYPSVGLKNYVDLMANKILGTLAANAANAVGNSRSGFTNLNMLYMQDYMNTLGIYDKASNASGAKKTALKKEMDRVAGELNNLKAFSNLVVDPGLESVGSATRLISDYNSSTKGGSLSAADSSYLKAIGQLRSDRKNQLKKMDYYKKAIAARGNKERAEKMEKAATGFGSKFSSPISTAGSHSSKFGSGLAETVTSAENANSDKGKSDSSYGANHAGMNPAGFGSGSALSQGSNVFGSGSSSGKNSSSSDSASAGDNGMSDEDRNRISDAIEARDRAKNKYQSDEGQTLFEKVTNAYIRNYDKVLTKRKDKEVIESNK